MAVSGGLQRRSSRVPLKDIFSVAVHLNDLWYNPKGVQELNGQNGPNFALNLKYKLSGDPMR